MFFKSLELQGFKSFPDRVKLEFEQGLTAVVGPNGSGKSNIGDAIRWVLGEQSTKLLRGNRMEDVIFSGTKRRKPSGFAAVTIQLDNQTGLFGESYGETIAITRKLYRSGESVYQINGKAVRLKDVQELLMDTGMGRDGYAIIGQGRIAEIVSARSTDRRELFEEATGVSKFRYKREEAERNLQAAQENLVRLQDIAATLEGRVEPLRQQAEVAKQFLKLSEQQKKLELSLWMQQLTGLDQEKAALRDTLLQARGNEQNAALDLKQADALLQEQYREMQQTTVRIQNLRESVQQAEETAAQTQADLAVCANEQQHNEQRLIQVAQQQKDAVAAEQTATEQLQTQQAAIQTLQEQKATAVKACQEQEQFQKELAKQLAAAAAAVKEAETKLRTSYGNQNHSFARAESLAAQIETIQAQTVSQTAQAAALQQQLQAAAETEQQTIDAVSAAVEAETAVRVALEAAQQQHKTLAVHLEQQQVQNAQRQMQLQTAQQRLQLLQEMEHNMEGYAGSVKAVLQAEHGKPHGVYGTVSQLLTTESWYSLAIETALGGAMQNIVVADETAAKDWIRYLKMKRAGRATFLPLTAIKEQTFRESAVLQEKAVIGLACDLVQYDAKFQNIVSSLLGRIVIAENLDDATQLAQRYGYRFRIVTLDGQVINAGGSFTGGSSQKKGGILTRKNEQLALQQTIQQLQEQVQADAEQFRQQKAAVQKQLEQVQTLQNQLHHEHAEQLLAAARAETAKKQSQQLQQQLSERQQQRKQLSEQVAALQQQHATAKAEWERVQADLTALQAQQQEAKQRQETLSAEQAAVREQLTTRQIAAAKLEQAYLSQQQQIAEQQERLQQCRQQKQQLTEAEAACREQAVQLQQQEQELQTKLTTCREQMTQHRKTIEQLQRIHTEQEQRIRQQQEGIRELSAARERAAAEVAQLETKQHTLEQQRDRIVQQMREQYDVTLSEANQLAEPISNELLAKQQLETLRRQIRALGHVNVSAIEEYQEVSRQWEFLSAQLQDATQAKQELETLIVQLTAEMQRIFTERFAGINQAFQEIFRELFDGGEASLSLSDPDDVLHSGIEIQVAPPGKVIKNLIALSGGEQSFVAIAIYFAILRQRPTPFCIMDEIDAALDEGNVRRYVQYLQRFRDTTQFILITHRRMAMEAADALYGVTMQEDGISRLLHMEQVQEAEA